MNWLVFFWHIVKWLLSGIEPRIGPQYIKMHKPISYPSSCTGLGLISRFWPNSWNLQFFHVTQNRTTVSASQRSIAMADTEEEYWTPDCLKSDRILGLCDQIYCWLRDLTWNLLKTVSCSLTSLGFTLTCFDKLNFVDISKWYSADWMSSVRPLPWISLRPCRIQVLWSRLCPHWQDHATCHQSDFCCKPFCSPSPICA